jgi:hypothetical protein
LQPATGHERTCHRDNRQNSSISAARTEVGISLVHDNFELPFAHDVPDLSYRFNILQAATDHDKFAGDFIAILDAIFPYGATTLTRGTENYLLLNILHPAAAAARQKDNAIGHPACP